MQYIIFPDVELWHYMLRNYEQDSNDVRIRALNRYCSKIQLVIRKLFTNLKVPPFLILNKTIRKELNGLKKGDSVLLCDYADPVLTMSISKLVNNEVKKYYWIWNPVTDKYRSFYARSFEIMRSYGYCLGTFDSGDAKQYGMSLYNQFFRSEIYGDSECLYDFYFIGFAKNREEEVLRLKDTLCKYRLLFKIVHTYNETITYDESIKNIMQSKCIVEIVQHEQTGMTLRPLESLFLHKKLLTNNERIIESDFYTPSNIFIIGKDDLSDIDSFLSTPFQEIPNSVSCRYSVDEWINHFR